MCQSSAQDLTITMTETKNNAGVLLINLGGPEKLNDVEPFLVDFFSDPLVIRLPFGKLCQKRFAKWLAQKRESKAREKYQAIGGYSPLIRETRKQAQVLSRILGIPVEFAMRYLSPKVNLAITNLEKQGVKRVVVIPLFPQYSEVTTGSIIPDFKKQNKSLPYIFIKDHYNHPGYINALADLLKNSLKKIDPSLQTHLLFTAHSVPERYVRRGDPYVSQTEETVRLIVSSEGIDGEDAIKFAEHSLAFQSKLGPIRWHRPSLEEELLRIREKGVEQLIVFPISFVEENLETLYDLDIEFKNLCLKTGIKNFIRVPCLGDSERYLKALAEMTLRAIERAQWERPDA
jgi:ferrochelatase